MGIKRLYRSPITSRKIYLKVYDTYELPEETFTAIFKIIDQYQRKELILMAKLKTSKYKCGLFCEGRNIFKYYNV